MRQDEMTHSQTTAADERRIWDIYGSVFHYPCLLVADGLGLFAVLSEQPLTMAQLSARLTLGPRGLAALIGVLASQRLIAEKDGLLACTAEARAFLTPGSRTYWGQMLEIGRANSPLYQEILDALRHERAHAGEACHDLGAAWRDGALGAERARNFTMAFQGQVRATAEAAATNACFAAGTRLLEVGAGPACLALAVARRRPDMTVYLLDLPPVNDLALGLAAAEGLEARVHAVSGDMFRLDWPTGMDFVVFSNVLHDWPGATASALLAKARLALKPGGHLVVHEMLQDEGPPGTAAVADFSMMMFLRTEGHQYTWPELSGLIRAAGFPSCERAPSAAYHSLITAPRG